MWGGRFAASPSALMEAINASIGFDRRLAAQDIAGLDRPQRHAGRGRASSRRRTGTRSIAGLQPGAEAEIEAGTFAFSTALEDIHMNVESRLRGDRRRAGRRGCTRRAAATTRSPPTSASGCATRIDRTDGQLTRPACRRCSRKAEAHAGTVMPGFTHLQSAQPVTFGHHLMAYVRCSAATAAASAIPARGSTNARSAPAALAGTSFPIDRRHDRAGARLRPADPQFARCRLRPRLPCSSSSPRPRSAPCISRGLPRRSSSGCRRRSASSACRTAGRPARASCRRSATPTPPSWCAARPAASSAALVALLTVMKGLPLAYSKDMQEDKEQLFDAADTIEIVARRDDRHGRGPGARARAHGGGRRGRLLDGDRSRRLAGAQPRHAVPRCPPRHRPHRRRRPRSAAAAWRTCRSRPCRRSSRRSTTDIYDVLGVENSVRSPDELRRHLARARRRAGRLVAGAHLGRAKFLSLGNRPHFAEFSPLGPRPALPGGFGVASNFNFGWALAAMGTPSDGDVGPGHGGWRNECRGRIRRLSDPRTKRAGPHPLFHRGRRSRGSGSPDPVCRTMDPGRPEPERARPSDLPGVPTSSLSGQLDTEMQQQLSILKAIASVPSLDKPDLAVFHLTATRMVSSIPQWTSMSLIDPSAGRAVLNTLDPARDRASRGGRPGRDRAGRRSPRAGNP